MWTETRVSSSSLTAEFRAYGRERFAQFRLVLLLALVGGLGLAVQPPHGMSEAVARLALAGLLIAQFRIWDDAADRDHDRLHHPARTSTRMSAVSLLAVALSLALPIGALLATADAPSTRLLAYGALGAFVAAVYSSVRARALRSALVLLKYPAFVLLGVAAPWSVEALAAAALAYVAVAAHDLRDASRARKDSRRSTMAGPRADFFEPVACYACGSREASALATGEDDLTGKPGRFTFVRCGGCGLAFQSPRLKIEHIGAYYDDEYIAHRKKADWGWLTPFYARAMDKHDRDKAALVARFAALDARSSVLDVGCGAGTFLAKLRTLHGVKASAVDFKDMSKQPWLRDADFRCGLFYEQDFGARRFDLITMWHFLEHDYDPPRTLRTASALLAPEGRIVIEVPRLDSVSWKLYRERWPGLQAPQHTVLFDRASLEAMVRAAGLEIVEYLPYGAFPAYFYLFAGAAFKVLRGRGLDLDRAILPYFAGQLLLAPVLLFERRLNLAMQTVVCRRAPEAL